ncbi:MAG: SDR family NAD(P)-dependent oxidoreductase, partial [Halioglobus sp.]|nr:SDR family NAD(P)-dependent oxidoreductase [Halioglobus sp.]
MIIMNMADLASVRRAAAELIEAGGPLHVLLNNAGVVNLSRRETVDGFEVIFAVNHLAPFLLTGLLLPALLQTPGSRIVNVASDAQRFVCDMGFDDVQAQ